MEPFPTPFGEKDPQNGDAPYTLVELQMMKALGTIKNKVRWYEKINDATIAKKWKDELIAKGLHPSQVEAIMEELKYFAKFSSKEMAPSPVDGVWQSDAIIDEELRQELIECVQPLEETAFWHPGSNEQMRDLLHPSVNPLVFGVSKNHDGKVIQPPIVKKANWSYFYPYKIFEEVDKDMSTKYQWLPSQVIVQENGECKITSYINNLPQGKLCSVLEKILGQFIPLFEKVLTELVHPRERRQTVDMSSDSIYGPSPSVEYDEAYEEWFENRTPKVPQEVPAFKEPVHEKIIQLKGRELQVIFKLADIVLTPGERGTYMGGSWHVEGMKNEAIVASGIYYYETENITKSKLSFRTAVREPDYEQNDNNGVKAVYGLVDDGPLVQEIGRISCIQGRSVVWPNTLQHKVQDFELENEDEPGVRKILVFFLVDPSIRILSTADLPQQHFSQKNVKKYMEELIKGTKILYRSEYKGAF